jgi:SAM-dependent methyltransferase
MTVLEPGPGMGFFTLELARLVGSGGRVLAVDVQPKMLAGLRRRAGKAGLLERIELRLAEPASLRVEDLPGQVDFTLAFAVVHEMPKGFFAQAAAASKRGGRLLLAEPRGHVSDERFAKQLEAAKAAGFSVAERPTIRGCHAALLTKE